MSGINLDAESVRAEMLDAPYFTDEQVAKIAAISDSEINNTILDVVDDHFWGAYDRVRSDAIDRLLGE
jgi:hypothetical protein